MTYTPDFIIDKKQFLKFFYELSFEEQDVFRDKFEIQDIENGFNETMLREHEYIIIHTELSSQVDFLNKFLKKNNIIYGTTY